MNKSSLSFRAAVLAMGNGTTAIVQMVIAAVLARHLTMAGYGTYKQAYLFYNLALPLLGLGLPAALLYFLPRNEKRGRGILSENLLILSGSGALLSLFLLLGGANLVAQLFGNPALSPTLRWFAIIPPFAFPMLAVAPSLIATNRPTWVASYSIAGGMLRLLTVLAPVLLIASTPLMAIKGAAIAVVIMFLPGMFLMYLAVSQGPASVTRAGIFEQIKYAAPLGIGTMIGTIHKLMDKTIVSTMVSTEEFAVFTNGAMEIPFISLITGSAAAVMVPELARLYSENKFEDALDLFRRSAIKCGTLLAPISGWFFISAPWVMRWLYGVDYVDSSSIFRIYLLMLPLRVAFFGPLFQAAGRSDLVMTRSIIGVAGNIILTIVGVLLFGPIGAAIGTVLSILIFAYSFCVLASAKLYKTTVIELLPLAALTRVFVPVVLIVAVLSTGSSLLQLSESLGLISWAVLSLLYSLAVVAAYLMLEIITVDEILHSVHKVARKISSIIRR